MKLQPHEYKVDSEGDSGWAVTVTHLATGISRSYELHRSAVKNKEMALADLQDAVDEARREAAHAKERRSRRYAIYLDGMELDSLKELVRDIRQLGIHHLYMSEPSDIEPIEYALNRAEEVV